VDGNIIFNGQTVGIRRIGIEYSIVRQIKLGGCGFNIK